MRVNGHGIATHADPESRETRVLWLGGSRRRRYRPHDMAGHLVPQCARSVVSVKKTELTQWCYLTSLFAERSDHDETVRGHMLHQLWPSRAASARAAVVAPP